MNRVVDRLREQIAAQRETIRVGEDREHRLKDRIAELEEQIRELTNKGSGAITA